jgi:hypothetical protein
MSLYKNSLEKHVLSQHINSMGDRKLSECYEFVMEPVESTGPIIPPFQGGPSE